VNGQIVEASHISRVFPMPAGPVTAVADVSLEIRPGDHIAIRGPSGCGKSTLLHMLGCVEPPTAGTLLFRGDDVTKLSDRQRSLLRLRQIGFVFQRFFLLPMLTAAENVELPQSEANIPKAERRQRTQELLEYVGLAARAAHRPSELSGGEMQRVAIARALANGPDVLLADEPTGNLDSTTGDEIVGVLRELWSDGLSVVLITHDNDVAAAAPRVVRMHDGRLGGVNPPERLTSPSGRRPSSATPGRRGRARLP
jgi:putative ABC transport system ATP-binding protein